MVRACWRRCQATNARLIIIIVLPGLETVILIEGGVVVQVQAVVGAVGLVVMGQDLYDPVGLRVAVSCIYIYNFQYWSS